MRGRFVGSLLFACAFLCALDAKADSTACSAGDSPWVRLILEGPYFASSLRASVLRQLTTDLELKGLAVCVTPAESEPVAEIRVTLLHPTELSIEVLDRVHEGRFTRAISLASVPRDALGLSIAATAEELLYASWAESALARPPTDASSPTSTEAPSPDPTPPPPTPAAAEASTPPPDAPEPLPRTEPPPPRSRTSAETHVYVVAASETATQGETALGGDVGIAWGGRATVGARAGFRAAPDASSPHGAVRMREGIFGLVGAYALVPPEAAWGGELVGHGDLLVVEFDGVASSEARSLSGTAAGFLFSGGLRGWARIGDSWRLVGEATVGGPIRGVTASDSGAVVTGIRGAVVGFALGIGTRL